MTFTNATNSLRSNPTIIDFNLRDQNGDNYFLQLIKKGDCKAAEDHLNDYSKHINDINYKDESAFHLAIKSRFNNLAMALFERGANLHQKNIEGFTPLVLALENEEVLWTIFKSTRAFADIFMSSNAFSIAIKKRMVQAILRLFEKGVVFRYHSRIISLFVLILRQGFQDIAMKLLSKEIVERMDASEICALFCKALDQKCIDFAFHLIKLAPENRVMCNYQSLLTKACEAGPSALELVNHLGLLAQKIIQDFDWQPKSPDKNSFQQWFFNIILQNDLITDQLRPILEQIFDELIKSAFRDEIVTFEPHFFQNALKITNPQKLFSILMEKLKKNDRFGWARSEAIKLLGVMGSEAAHIYFGSQLQELLEHLKDQGLQGHLSPQVGYILARVFPNETNFTLDVIDENTSEHQSIQVNFFILVTRSSFFRLYLSSRWSKRDNTIYTNPTLFRALYIEISEKRLESSSLSKEDLATLGTMACQFGIPDLLIGKSGHDESFLRNFKENGYTSCDRKEINFSQILLSCSSLEECHQKYGSKKEEEEPTALVDHYLTRCPNIDILRIGSDFFSYMHLSKINLLKPLKEIHVIFSNDLERKIPQEKLHQNVTALRTFVERYNSTLLQNCGFYLKGGTEHNLDEIIAMSRIVGSRLRSLDLSHKDLRKVHVITDALMLRDSILVGDLYKRMQSEKQFRLPEIGDVLMIDALRTVPSENLEHLNLSGSTYEESKLIDLLLGTRKLRVINLEDSNNISQETIYALPNCQHLESVSLSYHPSLNILYLAQVCESLTTLKICQKLITPELRQKLDNLVQQIMKESEKLSIYVDKGYVLRNEEIPKEIQSIVELVNRMACGDFYLLEDGLNVILKRVLNHIFEGGMVGDDGLIVKILDEIAKKKSESIHPLVSFFNSNKQSDELKRNCLALASTQKLCLDVYLSKVEVQQLRRRLGTCELSLLEARTLSKLFGKEHHVSVKASEMTFSIDPLILQASSSEILRNWTNKGMIEVFYHPKIYNYIHCYLTEGKVDLKRLNIHEILECLKVLEEHGITFEDFFNTAEDGKIGLELTSYTRLEEIHRLLDNSNVDDHLNTLDLTKFDLKLDLKPILELVQHTRNLKTIHLSAKNIIPPDLLNALTEKKEIELVIDLDQQDQLQKFAFPPIPRKNEVRFRLCLNNFRFSTMTEYFKFIETFPELIEMDVSTYPLKHDSSELTAIISLCQKKNVSTLRLGNCTNLTSEDFDKIAKNCPALKTLIYEHAYPSTHMVQKIFTENGRYVDCQVKKIQAH